MKLQAKSGSSPGNTGASSYQKGSNMRDKWRRLAMRRGTLAVLEAEIQAGMKELEGMLK
jgi:hypothetical protein